MDLSPLRKRLPFAVAVMFYVLAYVRPAQRGIWMILGTVFLVIGLRRSRRNPPATTATGRLASNKRMDQSGRGRRFVAGLARAISVA